MYVHSSRTQCEITFSRIHMVGRSASQTPLVCGVANSRSFGKALSSRPVRFRQSRRSQGFNTRLVPSSSSDREKNPDSSSQSKVQSLQLELEEVVAKARQTVKKGSDLAVKGAELKELARKCVAAGNDYGAQTHIEAFIAVRKQVETSQCNVELLRSLAAKLMEAIQAEEERGTGAFESFSNPPSNRSWNSDSLSGSYTTSDAKPPRPSALDDREIEDRFRDIELNFLENMLKEDLASKPPVTNRADPPFKSKPTEPTASTITKPADSSVLRWWQSGASSAKGGTVIATAEDRAVLQKKLQKIASRRMQGTDPSLADCVEVRQLCEDRGVSGAGIDELKGGLRTSLYRLAVGEVLKVVAQQDTTQLKGHSPRAFVCGLASDLGLEEEQTIVIVSSAVAALTRSYLLQGTAHLRNGDVARGKVEMSELLEILKQFPPSVGSVEMELLAYSLEKPITMAEKNQLLQLARRSALEPRASESVAQALGLSVVE